MRVLMLFTMVAGLASAQLPIEMPDAKPLSYDSGDSGTFVFSIAITGGDAKNVRYLLSNHSGHLRLVLTATTFAASLP